MKKNFFVLPLIGLLSLGFVACGDEEENGNESNTPTNGLGEEKNYIGTFSVTNPDGSIFSNDAFECLCTEGSALDIVLLKAKFSEKMPVALDSVKVLGVAYDKENGTVSFAADSIVPYWNNKPFAAYTVKNLSGTVANGSLQFTATMGSYPVSYKGVKK